MDEGLSNTSAPVAPEEEIIEKKPFHPVETSLLIISFLVLCFAIYLVSDELGMYASANEYSTGKNAAGFYTTFKRDKVEMGDINAETEGMKP